MRKRMIGVSVVARTHLRGQTRARLVCHDSRCVDRDRRAESCAGVISELWHLVGNRLYRVETPEAVVATGDPNFAVYFIAVTAVEQCCDLSFA